MKAYPKSFPEGKDLKNAQRPLWFLLQDMGKKIDVNAFAMERFYNMKNIIMFDSERLS